MIKNQIKLDLVNRNQAFVEDKFNISLAHSKTLTLDASEVKERDVIFMRSTGLSDGEILEINQVVSSFKYANRTALSLGVSTKGDVIGLSPNNSDHEKNWNYQ